MPLDGHSYLVSQGWTGSGTGLRQGAISRPLAIPQKKSLAGLGKDRDEAFPFWDHLFSAASKAIQIKISSDDEDSDAEPGAAISLKRTSTGILSNRRPAVGASAEGSGSTTPDATDTSTRLSLLATAKREAAKRGLYSRFLRGPVLGPDSPLAIEPGFVVAANAPNLPGASDTEEGPIEKKRKRSDGEDERRERKRMRKETKALDKAERSREKAKTNSDTTEHNEKKKRRRELDTAPPRAESHGGLSQGRKRDPGSASDSEKAKRKKERKEKRKIEKDDPTAKEEISPSDFEKARRKRERKEQKRKSEAAKCLTNQSAGGSEMKATC